MRCAIFMTLGLTGLLCTGPVASEEAINVKHAIEGLWERLTPEAQQIIGKHPAHLDAGGYELALALLRPLAEGRGPVQKSRMDTESRIQRHFAGQRPEGSPSGLVFKTLRPPGTRAASPRIRAGRTAAAHHIAAFGCAPRAIRSIPCNIIQSQYPRLPGSSGRFV